MKKRDVILLAIAMFILIAGCLQSCSVEKKILKAQGIAYQYPDRFTDFCAKAFPVVPKYIKGKDSIVEKTIAIKGDSIPCPPNENGEVKKVKCPDQKVIYRDVLRVDTVEKENTAKLKAVEQSKSKVDEELSKSKESLSDMIKHRNKWRQISWVLGGIITSVLLFKIYRFIKR